MAQAVTKRQDEQRSKWRIFLDRRLRELAALGLVLLALALILACISFDPRDPAPNVAASASANNWLGWPGAYAADIFLRSLGLAAFLIPPALLAWAWRLLRDHQIPRLWLRVTLLPLALVCAAMALSALPNPPGWPLTASGTGGALGLVFWNWIWTPIGLGLLVPAFVSLVAALALGLYCLGLTRQEWVGLGQRLKRGASAVRGGFARASRGPLLTNPFRRKQVDEEAASPSLQRQAEAAPVLERSPRKAAAPNPSPKAAAGASAGAEIQPAALPSRKPTTVEAPAPRPVASKTAATSNQGRLPLSAESDYTPPPLALLHQPTAEALAGMSKDALEKNARLLETVLQDFGVRGEIVRVRPGPVVTRYELEPAPGTKTSRVVGLADDIARSMSAVSVRVAVVPGSTEIGIELPNSKREVVALRELLASEAYEKASSRLPLTLGKDISGAPVITDLSRMPHLLIAGTTGSGKSVAVNAMLCSLLFTLPPERCRLILIDPKMLELSVYDDIPHLLSPVVTDPKKAVVALKWTVREMEERYRNMSRLGVRNIDGYNARIIEARESGETLTRKVQTGFDPDTGNPIYEDQPFDLNPLPYIVVVVDEMADLMLVAGKDIEMAVQRLAQMARAAGIHIIMATQRPSVDVITGTIKANFPTRISFHVTSKIDSRTILGEPGAEQLLGHGDMLYMAHGGRITRVHGPLVTDQEVEAVVEHLKTQGAPDYLDAVTEDDEDNASNFEAMLGGGNSGGEDDLYQRAVAVVCQHRKASTSFVQRQLQIGYNRAARLIERMESEGLVSAANHVGKREILIHSPEEMR